MVLVKNFKKLSFLVYGLGLTGQSVVNFFHRNNIQNFQVWDDINRDLYKRRRPESLNKALKEVSYIVLSPGVSLNKSKNKTKLTKYKKKIITDIDLIFLLKKFWKSIVITGTNGKSTTSKIVQHLLIENNYKALLGGNIGTPILDLQIRKDNILVIEASSFQLSHSKFISPDYAILLNITNDHLDWHGSMKNYIDSKFKIFEKQKKTQFSFVNKNFKKNYQNRNLKGKLIIPDEKKYKKLKFKIKNLYLNSKINDENMTNVLSLAKVFKISEKSFLTSFDEFKGLPHRYEIFLKKKNYTFINDSKATSFEASKFALLNTKNIFWILGGLPKKNDKIYLNNLKLNLVKCYIIGKHVNFFKKQLKNSKVNFTITKNLKNSILQILKDITLFKKKENIILLSPSAASFDQFRNFEKRGENFKKLVKQYARKYI